MVFANAPNGIWNATGLHAVTVPARTVAKAGDRNQHLARDIAGCARSSARATHASTLSRRDATNGLRPGRCVMIAP